MREILFKAKRKDNGEWVEGCFLEKIDLLLGVKKHFILNQKDANSSFDWHNVDPETVCQYTGLMDKNGRKVFDGDEIIAKGSQVDWNYLDSWVVDFNNLDTISDLGMILEFEVIGNIHDEE